jgi:hypothetical protein
MTTHELARLLLGGPDLPVGVWGPKHTAIALDLLVPCDTIHGWNEATFLPATVAGLVLCNQTAEEARTRV